MGPAPGAAPTPRLTATDAARDAIARLAAERGEAVMFVQSGGCCAGSTPMCYPIGEFPVSYTHLTLPTIYSV